MKTKKILLTTLLTMSISTTALAAKTDIKININGYQLNTNVPVEAVNGRTLVPMRAIFEAMGARVEWDNKTSTATGIKGNDTIKLQIGNNTASINGKKLSLDTPAIISKGSTLVPVRFVAESLGADVGWDGPNRLVTISTQDGIIYRDKLDIYFSSIDKNDLNREAYNGFYFSEKDIVKILGQPTSKSKPVEYGYGGEHQDWIYQGKGIKIDMNRFGDGDYGTSFIYLESPFKYKTKEGIGIGSTKEQVVAAYKDIITRYEKDHEGNDIIVLGQSSSSGMAIVFKNNRVNKIQMGEHPN